MDMTESKALGPDGPLFVFALRAATEAAARAAFDWLGSADRSRRDRVATKAMRRALDGLPLRATVVVGEVPDEDNADLSAGQTVGGDAGAARFDVCVDPVEGISYLARGMTNAMAVIGLAPEGALFDPGPAFYMEKFAAPPAAKGLIDPARPVEERLRALSEILEKPVSALRVFVLEKPRHRGLVERIRGAGARVALYPAGDVAGAVSAAIPGSGIDALMGTGGVREGILSACAIRALGGEFMARIDPQLATERAAVAAAGLDTEGWRPLEALVASDEVCFVATGITTGLLLEGVERTGEFERTESLLIAGPRGERQLLTTFHRRDGGG